MIFKSLAVIFLAKVILAQTQNTTTKLDVTNNPFFNKFFKEFEKQYEELQKLKAQKTITVLDVTKNPFMNKFFKEFEKQNEELQENKVQNTTTDLNVTNNPFFKEFEKQDEEIQKTKVQNTAPDLNVTNNPFFKEFENQNEGIQKNKVQNTATDLNVTNNPFFKEFENQNEGIQKTTAQTTTTDLNISNNPFFKEFEKRNEEHPHQTEKVSTTPPTPTTYKQTTTHNNPFLSSQSTERPKFKIRRPSKQPTINPANPYFTISADFIRPTRRTHINPFLRRTTSRKVAITSHNSLVDISTEPSKPNDPDNEKLLKDRFQGIIGDKLNTNEDFLSFVQTALMSPKLQDQQVSTKQQSTAQSVPDVVRRLVEIVPKPKVDTKPKVKQELKFRPREDFFMAKSKVKNEYADKLSKKKAENIRYTFGSDVQDSINGNFHQRHEQREGNKVSGMYASEDGFYRRTVYYLADEMGYRILKEDVQEIGDGPLINPGGTAKVKAYLAGNVVNYQVTNEDIQKKKPVRYQTIQEPKYSYY